MVGCFCCRSVVQLVGLLDCLVGCLSGLFVGLLVSCLAGCLLCLSVARLVGPLVTLDCFDFVWCWLCLVVGLLVISVGS